MGDDPAPETSTRRQIRPFSVILTSTTNLIVRSATLIRYLRGARNCVTGGGDPRPSSPHPTLNSVVIAVQAQPCILHLFRGRRLCRVIQFNSPIADVSGLPSSDASLGVLCVVACRNGTVYELPAEVLDRQTHSDVTSVKEGTCVTRDKSTSKSSLDIFDDLAPTMASSSCPASQQARDHGSYSNGDRSQHVISPGGMVLSARDAWIVFCHLGARRIATCPGYIAAITGIVDRTASYRFGADMSNRPKRRLATLEGVDGTAPTTTLVVWMKQAQGGEDNIGSKDVALPVDVFRALFGSEITISETSFPPQRDSTANSSSETGKRGSQISGNPAVMLVGDAAGVVRWAPLSSGLRVAGGVIAKLGQSVVGILPQLDSNARAIGLVIVGAKGAVLTLAGTPPESSRQRSALKSAAGARKEIYDAIDEVQENPALICLRRAQYRLPFPVAAACSTPGFLVHSHAGALFASALPEGGSENANVGEERLGARDASSACSPDMTRRRRGSAGDHPREKTDRSLEGIMLRPVRLPLPCEAADVAAVQVVLDDEVTLGGSPPAHSPVTVVFSLSARGRLIAFLSPTSTEELEDWSLDTGKGGVRVGGSAVVERRVRCQLERLSSVGQNCATLSAESEARDREIRVLRGASRLIPGLVTNPEKRLRISANGGIPGEDLQAALAHSVSMEPDQEVNFPGVEHVTAGEIVQHETLRVQLRVRVWAHEGGRSRWLPEPGEEGSGRWFVTNQLVSEGGLGNDAMSGDFAWSVTSPLPIGLLRQGREWVSSTSLSLPSTHPVTVTTWLQLRFDGEIDADLTRGGNLCTHGGAVSGTSGGVHPIDSAGGISVELGTARFDILDWGVRLASVPGSDSAIRGNTHGRGVCLGGSDMIISDVLHELRWAGRSRVTASGEELKLPSRHALNPLGRCSVFVAHPDCDARALLAKLVAPSTCQSSRSSKSSASVSGARGSVVAEAAIRVGGQVAVFRAIEHEASVSGGGSARGEGSAAGVEITAICSHDTMLPLVRHALLRRAREVNIDQRADGRPCFLEESSAEVPRERVGARAQAAERLSREVHALRRVCVEAGDEARGLGFTRVREGPQWASAIEARAIMERFGEVYKSLRHQQEGRAVV